MTEHLISMFIDDELDLGEKIEFVETVHADASYTSETVALLAQEKQLRTDPVEMVPPVADPWSSMRMGVKWLRPLMIGLGSAAVAICLWIALGIELVPDSGLSAAQSVKSHRFIIYRPDVSSAQVLGNFTGWQPRSMHRVGDSGYWELELDLPGGEHRFAYILEGNQRIADPTVPVREQDDFGGENSILRVAL